ncbi:MAG TPA: MYXO-CTERM sorting domain-containing protein [Kofleriaceae bacterium]
MRSTYWNLMFSALFVVAMGACSGATGCGACSSAGPLPAGGLPVDQTIEGGAQIRITPQGFQKLTSILPGVVNSALGSGFCLGQGTIGSPGGTFGTGAYYCDGNEGASCNPGCEFAISVNSLSTNVTNNQTLHLALSTSVSTTVNIDGKIVGIPFSCSLGISSNNLSGDIDIAFGTDPTTGELTIHLADINNFQTNFDFSGCSFVSSIANFASDFIDSFVGQFIVQLLTPTIDNLIQGFLPNPLGIENMIDVGALLSSVSPGTKAEMEARIVPGGYVSLDNVQNGGMSLGVITGLNSDEDTSTRNPPLQSEPALCVPPLPPTDFGAPPASLPMSSRGTYTLAVADEFNGSPDPAADLAMGVSETTLDLAGHHLVTSGALCLGVGTSYISQLNVSTIGLLVPSLAQLQVGDENDPLLLVTRPQRALDFTIGENTTTSPAITIGISHMEVDFYAFLYQRYVRAFTMDLSLNVGINLDFEQMPGQDATIKPTLVGIDSHDVTVSILNSEFVKESPDQLAAALPSVFDLVTPLLGNIPDITVPSFAGFTLNNLQIQHVTTAQDDFLALYATLGTSQMMRQLSLSQPMLASAVAKIDGQIAEAAPISTGTARLVSVKTPAPDVVLAGLANQAGGALPTVELAVDTVDSMGRQLEWSYRLDNGLWHAWRPAVDRFLIEDHAFAIQGKYNLGIRSRVVGDYHTVSQPVTMPIVIDSVGPRVITSKATTTADSYEVPLFDIVSGTAVSWGWGRSGDAGPSEWQTGSVAKISHDEWEALALDNGVTLFARDESGNISTTYLVPFHGQGDGTGCACNSGGRIPSTGGLALFGLVGVLVMRRRRPLSRNAKRAIQHATVVGLFAGLTAFVPSCSCDHKEGDDMATTCDVASDCGADFCMDGQIAFCIDGTCVCGDDVPVGRLGSYSHVAVGGDGTVWVSAYAETHGDLVVAQAPGGRIPDTAWQWVDGVPPGPVTVPGSMIRGGISDDGPNTGMYTSIAVGPDNQPMVSYFDVDSSSLKFAQRAADGTWAIHIVDQGDAVDGMLGSTQVGMYTSLTLRSDDGRPGIAYLAHVADAAGGHAEVRYASAQTAHPTSAGDWQTWVVAMAPLPAVDPNNPDVYPLPEGLGLFIDSARMPDNAPAVAFYDRSNGDLLLSKYDIASGAFDTPVTLAGSDGTDEGWTPSISVAADGTVSVAYVDATDDDLDIVSDASGATPVIVDDGYRIVGQTVDGLPKPTFDLVGDNAAAVAPNGAGAPMIAYQDATTQELLLAQQGTDGTWTHISIAGATTPWPGAYGFYASAAYDVPGNSLEMSTWVIDQPTGQNWVETFSVQVGVQ